METLDKPVFENDERFYVQHAHRTNQVHIHARAPPLEAPRTSVQIEDAIAEEVTRKGRWDLNGNCNSMIQSTGGKGEGGKKGKEKRSKAVLVLSPSRAIKRQGKKEKGEE